MKPIYHYTDYRQYLRDQYVHLKATQRRFSYRAMSARLGFAAPNFLKLVIDGKRNLGRESIDKVTGGLELNRRESEYFSYLVFFLQAKDPVEKNYFFGLIAAMRARTSTTLLQADQFEYLSRWYHPVVRELVAKLSDPLDYDRLSARLGNMVSPSKIRQSVTLLLRLGLLTRTGENRYRQSAVSLNTENELNSFAVRQYHEQILKVAGNALHAIPPAQREIASTTLHLSKTGFEKIKKRLQEFREELLQIATDDTDPEYIYHANLQFYPLTGAAPDENV